MSLVKLDNRSLLSAGTYKNNPILRLKQAILSLPTSDHRFCVAFSGGLDSNVLLHAMKQLFFNTPLIAVHINHGLHAESLTWEKHCKEVCQTLDIPLKIQNIKIGIDRYRKKGNSPEEAFRKARYQALVKQLQKNDCLLTAHHLEDQSETLLLQMIKGSGIKGLASMPLLTQLGNAYHLRPLLSWSYQERLKYAQDHSLRWIEDPSNTDVRYDRNFLRHSVFPILNKRWPQIHTTLNRVTAHCAEASQLCAEVAKIDLSLILNSKSRLSIELFLSLSPMRGRNALRHWLNSYFEQPLPTTQVNRIEQLLYMPKGSHVGCSFKGRHFKRFQEHLYILNASQTMILHNDSVIPWDTSQPLHLSNWGTLVASKVKGKGIKYQHSSKMPHVEIRFRKGGERFHPQNRIGTHPLKKLYQEWSIPPWERYSFPLIYWKEQLIAVPGYAISAPYAAKPNEWGILISTIRRSVVD